MHLLFLLRLLLNFEIIQDHPISQYFLAAVQKLNQIKRELINKMKQRQTQNKKTGDHLTAYGSYGPFRYAQHTLNYFPIRIGVR